MPWDMVSTSVNGTRRLTAGWWGGVAIALLVAHCGGMAVAADSPVTPPPPGSPASVSVTAALATLPAHGTTQLSAKVLDSKGAPVAGVMVRFGIVDGANGSVVSPGGLTNSDGIANATLTVGVNPGAVSVRVEVEGGSNPFAIAIVEVAPPVPHLNRNYFNPSRGERLRINVDVPAPARFAVSVVGMSGEVVRQIESGSFASGQVVREWDGRTETGETVPSGIYFVRVQNGSTLQIRKVIVLRL